MFERMVFAADVHLHPEEEGKTRRFTEFLRHAATENQAIFLLGDLFEFWVGPRHAKLPDYAPVLDTLREISGGGCKLYFIGGNRDFLFHAGTGNKIGMEVCGDPRLVQLGERRIFLTHGDALCLSDVRYRRMKRVLQNPVTKFIARHLPLSVSMRAARRLRSASAAEVRRKSAYEMDLTPSAVRAVFERGADVLICGHVHKPRHEKQVVNGRECELLVVGDWHGPAAYVRYADGCFELNEWS